MQNYVISVAHIKGDGEAQFYQVRMLNWIGGVMNKTRKFRKFICIKYSLCNLRVEEYGCCHKPQLAPTLGIRGPVVRYPHCSRVHN